MVEKLIEAKDFIDAGKLEEAKAKIDEVIAGVPAKMSNKEPEPIEPDPEDPLPGQGTNGRPPKK